MKLQVKIALSIIPLVLLGIFILGAWSIEKTKESIYNANLLYMDTIIDSYMIDVNKISNLLIKNGLDKVDSFVSEYKQKALDEIEAIQFKETSKIFIFNSAGEFIFSSNKSNKSKLVPVWGPVAERISTSSKLNSEFQLRSEGINNIYVVRIFKPWNWVVFFAKSDVDVHHAETQIKNATMGIASICSLLSILLILVIFKKFFVTPINHIVKAASAIANGQDVKSIDVLSKDELGDLARHMETMSNAIQENQAEIKSTNINLEKIVEERTSDLVKANRELSLEIEERKRTEGKIKESEELFKAVFEQAGGYCMILQPSDSGIPTIVDANTAACKEHGYSRNEIIGRPVADLDDEEGKRLCIERTQRIMSGVPFELETEHVRKDGSSFPVAVYANIVHFENRQPLIVTTEFDISEKMNAKVEKKSLEKRLQQAQKMESIGNLAGGIAHDFNNLLFPIIGFAEMLMEDLPEGSTEYDSAQEIFIAGKRGGELVKQILSFSRQADNELRPVQLQKILKEVLTLTRSSIPADIEIQQKIQQDCGVVMAEPTQIHQIGINLITNAFHAVEKSGGEILVQLKETMVADSDFKDSLLQPGKYAMLSISDNGVGISRNIINNIFEPYFTTKDQGKGTGLGLAVVYGIVKEHSGDIIVTSKEGKGTAFNVYLPLMSKTTEAPLNDQVLVLQTGTERILLVDDEESVVRLEKQMLERLGYNVVAQSSSIEALELFKTSPGDYDLVVTDMTMPNMTGDQLAKEILSIKSEMPIIICTGFSERIDKEKSETIGVRGFLMKPVVKSEITQMIRELLDDARLKNK